MPLSTLLTKQEILAYLKQIKSCYESEGFIILGLFGSYARDEQNDQSDIDILYELRPAFASKYGFRAVAKIREIQWNLEKALGKSVDLASRSGMGKVAQEYIIQRTIYV